MSGRCTICAFDRRPEVDYALAAGLAQRAVAAKYGLSPAAVHRHSQAHLPPELRAALALKLLVRQGDVHSILLEEGASVAQSLAAIRGPLFGLYLRAVDIGDSRA